MKKRINKKIERDIQLRLNFKNSEIQRNIYKIIRKNEILPLDLRLQYANKELEERKEIKDTRVRQRNYCLKSGRSRGVFKYYGLSRMWFKHKAEFAEIPGISRGSW